MQKQAQLLFVCLFKVIVLGMKPRVCVLGKQSSNKLPSDRFSQLLMYTVVYTLVSILLHLYIFPLFFKQVPTPCSPGWPSLYVMAILQFSCLCLDHKHKPQHPLYILLSETTCQEVIVPKKTINST